MKKAERILVIVIVSAACLIWAVSNIFFKDAGDILRITVDNEIYGEYSLNQDQMIEINGSNICEIADGEVRMIQADCPDQICIKTNAITKKGGTIICLPNRVFLEVIPTDTSIMADTIAS